MLWCFLLDLIVFVERLRPKTQVRRPVPSEQLICFCPLIKSKIFVTKFRIGVAIESIGVQCLSTEKSEVDWF